MVEVISEICRSVFREHGRSASISSRWFTDVFSLMRDSTSQRTRYRSTTCRGPIWGGRFVRKKP